MTVVREFAPAKVNLGLAVLGKRSDGYHEIESLMVTFDVGDDLSCEPAREGIQVVVEGTDLPTGPGNLAYRAAEVYLKAAEQTGGVRIGLSKSLPLAAGLGGGSSDAAAVLRAMARLYPALVDMQGLARGLGADVPFLVAGGSAVARGVGEILEPLPLPSVHLVLVNPGIAVSAAAAYRGLSGRFGPPLDLAAIRAALLAGAEPPYRNDLETPVLELQPEIAAVKDVLRGAGLRGVLMSGSGSTVFGLAPDRVAAERIASGIAARHPGWWVRAASSTAT